MTTEGFREVDDDLLADYLGGALDGTPQQAEVARLVDSDPAWAEAHARLGSALTQVRADLADWAEPSPVMPPAVADRLLAALAAAADDTAAAPGVVPAQGGAGRRPGPVAVAAVAVVGVALGLNQLSMNASDTAGTSALNQPASAPEGAATAGWFRA
ncbi:hypothetical protein FHG89_31860, partial [Micromonospora orduensis]